MEDKQNVIEDNRTPSREKVPWNTWTGSTRKHKLAYRVWRNKGDDQAFTGFLEVQIKGRARLDVVFTARSEPDHIVPGLRRSRYGSVFRSGSHPSAKRTTFALGISKWHEDVDWTLSGTWRKDFLGAIISSRRINHIPYILGPLEKSTS
ncbi:hypothetical protein CSHISOI_10682 [Colletotrichum shisoi]|uniref:Uncharacterized protein n=1 Tax=Colletotrichum shisoi TaxID=2078593 RepID=A0A5Q4BCX2_9PEZI|nr:hypothetical protein CSHISOI_10682 [Colletotrichum shisoi]